MPPWRASPSLAGRADFHHGLLAFVATSVLAGLGCGTTTATAGFWFEDVSFALPAPAAEKIGGLLTDAELESIQQISRTELEHAFAGLRIRVTDDRRSFWRVEVVRSLRGGGPLPHTGESRSFGWLGGSGGVSFDLVALMAIRYAPERATRQAIIEGIGRGIGRVAAHELAHQILNSGAVHNEADENSYEYPRPDRASQYYGELHWTTARPFLEQKLR